MCCKLLNLEVVLVLILSLQLWNCFKSLCFKSFYWDLNFFLVFQYIDFESNLLFVCSSWLKFLHDHNKVRQSQVRSNPRCKVTFSTKKDPYHPER